MSLPFSTSLNDSLNVRTTSYLSSFFPGPMLWSPRTTVMFSLKYMLIVYFKSNTINATFLIYICAVSYLSQCAAVRTYFGEIRNPPQLCFLLACTDTIYCKVFMEAFLPLMISSPITAVENQILSPLNWSHSKLYFMIRCVIRCLMLHIKEHTCDLQCGHSCDKQNGSNWSSHPVCGVIWNISVF